MTTVKDDYVNVEGINNKSGIEVYTTAITEPENWANPRGYRFSLEEDESVPHTHIHLNTNGFPIFSAAQIRELIGWLTTFANRIEANQ